MLSATAYYIYILVKGAGTVREEAGRRGRGQGEERRAEGGEGGDGGFEGDWEGKGEGEGKEEV